MTVDPTVQRHLVTVWNPSYGTDVMESHIMMLREHARKYRSKEVDDESVYICWGGAKAVP